MAVKSYIVPVHFLYGAFEPSLMRHAQSLPGYERGGALINDGKEFCVYSVWADDFSDLDSHVDAVSFGGTPQGKFSEYIASLDDKPFNAHAKKAGIVDRLAKIGFTQNHTGKSTAQVFRELMGHLQPGVDDFVFEKTIPNVKQTITDNFTGGSLGSGWEAASGTIWTTSASAARPVDTYAVSACVRTEASFPNDQYAQGTSPVLQNDTIGTARPAVRITGNTYYDCAANTSADGVSLYRYNAGVATYMTDVVTTATLTVEYVWKISATGTVITVDQDAVNKITFDHTSGGVISSGKPGMSASNNAGGTYMKAFSSTDASGGGGITLGYFRA